MVVEIDRLYGVVHGASLTALIYQCPLELKPATELLEDLAKLPSGTSVGIEDVDSAADLDTLCRDMDISMSGRKYWVPVVEQCKKQGLRIVYLEDIEDWKTHNQMVIDIHKLHETLDKTQANEQALRDAVYAKEAEAQYFHQVVREEHMLKNIAEKQPRIVLLGRGHTDPLMDMHAKGKLDVRIKEYVAEEMPDLQFLGRKLVSLVNAFDGEPVERISELLESHIKPNPFNRAPLLDPETLAERDVTLRVYRAAKEGRITDGSPDYVGTWSDDVRARGLFELFINTRSEQYISGIIEDTIGRASFTGTIDEEGEYIHFKKRYEHAATLMGGLPGVISYDCSKKGGLFVGNWHGPHGNQGKFEMTPQQKTNGKVVVEP